MTLLTPLGLLGLIGILILIIIYIIKPNFQQKVVSSTFIWQLSLKYRKRRLPTSKLRNILLIICQILILASCAAVLAQPAQILKVQTEQAEIVAIIDASASMRAESDGVTRFERAVREVQDLAEQTFAGNGFVSVIVCEKNASFLVQRAEATDSDVVIRQLSGLLSGDIDGCKYGVSDVNDGVTLCESIVIENPSARIFIYTDATYGYVPDGIEVVNMANEEEWNVSILNAYTELADNYYTVTVEVASYGKDVTIDLMLDVYGPNTSDRNDNTDSRSISAQVDCVRDTTVTVVFDPSISKQEEADLRSTDAVKYVAIKDDHFYSYQSIHVTVNEDDSLSVDNTYDIYGGQKQVLKMQYYSSLPNNFFKGIFSMFQEKYGKNWDIQYTEVNSGNPAVTGFDFYVFEHTMPSVLPTDGVVLLMDPDSAPNHSGFQVGGMQDFNRKSITFAGEDVDHPIMAGIHPDNITVSRYTKLKSYDISAYDVLMTCGTEPMLLVKNQDDAALGECPKMVVMPFSFHYSNLSILMDWPVLMMNVFEYFFPVMVDGYSFEVDEFVSIRARGQKVEVSSAYFEGELTEFPTMLQLTLPGTYTLSQVTFAGEEVVENIYVKVPNTESNIFAAGGSIVNPYHEQDLSDFYRDLVVFIAAALVALLFAEWWLQSRENA